MNSLDFLKQAQLADSLGYFRLADKLYNKAARTVTASILDEAILKTLEKAGIKAGEKASIEAIEAALADAIMTAIRTGDSLEFRLLAQEIGLSEEATSEMIKEAHSKGRFDPNLVKRMARVLETKLNSEDSIFKRMIKDTPPVDPAPSKTPVDKIKDTYGNIKQKINAQMKKLGPKAVKQLKTFGIIAVGSVALGWYFVKANGDPASDEEVDAALSGSGMYDTRMQAGQQQGQNEKAQAYVDANKGKFTSQRDFYNAALGAGDKNFANDVIAIVKKDLDLPIEASSSGSSGSETSSYLNKEPYSGK
jgi:hypothetical protein